MFTKRNFGQVLFSVIIILTMKRSGISPSPVLVQAGESFKHRIDFIDPEFGSKTSN